MLKFLPAKVQQSYQLHEQCRYLSLPVKSACRLMCTVQEAGMILVLTIEDFRCIVLDCHSALFEAKFAIFSVFYGMFKIECISFFADFVNGSDLKISRLAVDIFHARIELVTRHSTRERWNKRVSQVLIGPGWP
ncbi:hypothetical protein O6H91_18G011300 [Diphasiastrum complanatum]|uniref:Uncharacterized protein n=1 Tax=Diphasiastrum complanatum TaxID=34168 RepID=A0ACC2AZ12_DIPCM|nr:hypothetical protein O6H91_18G011300 [Diphasiastrum complanatum]